MCMDNFPPKEGLLYHEAIIYHSYLPHSALLGDNQKVPLCIAPTCLKRGLSDQEKEGLHPFLFGGA